MRPVLTLGLALAFTLFAAAAQARPVCAAVSDAASGRVLRAEGDCATRITPASTFKIALALMGYDAGELTDAHAPALPFKEGYVDWRPEWRQTTDPTSWMDRSVVWYSQQLTGRLGQARFEAYVRAFRYGDGDVSGGLTKAWLSSSLKISPLEQVDFVGRMLRRELPVAPSAVERTLALLPTRPETPGGWTIHGKTGSGAPRTPTGAYDAAHEYGWYVGWAEKDGRVLTFAYLIQLEGASDRSADEIAREAFLAAAPGILAP
ncbi:class D beta-lactamase [Caulobacter sp. 17J80-11]|uniref:class D beta-lactamase n=1 Tax=Caulobacter sp. 17J80-11 TaxID=2763502 RepID=UPI001653E721|nr:class D beta-lactamase [Caulobacter sp. 17J80-11]MBC6982605.1 class D beta-lactamase [Caulobacter sp. 17J80-11]